MDNRQAQGITRSERKIPSYVQSADLGSLHLAWKAVSIGMVQPRVEWSIVGSAVRRSVIGLRVSYISSLSLFLEEERTPKLSLLTVLVSRTTMDERSTVCPGCWDSSLLHNRPVHCPRCLRFAASPTRPRFFQRPLVKWLSAMV